MDNADLQQVLDFVRNNGDLLGLLLFFMAMAESIIIASAFVPSSVIFVGIGALEGAAGPLLSLVIAGALGAVAGDLVSFAIGVWQRDNLKGMWPLRGYPDMIAKAQSFFEKWGTMAVLVSKLSGPLRPIVPMLAGASRMPVARFVAVSAMSSVIWSTLVLVPAYYGAVIVTG